VRYAVTMRKYLLGLAMLLVACGSNRSTGDGGDDPTGDGGSGAACGGLTSRRCGASEYCDYANNTCGIADEAGTCRTRPKLCPALVGLPTCGCDGQVYAGECSTYLNATDLDANGGCPVEATKFACGYLQCDLATQYCRRERPASGAETFACVGLPGSCASTASCTCLVNERCGNQCSGDGKSGLTLRCQ
jgi:hypothetical protein